MCIGLTIDNREGIGNAQKFTGNPCPMLVSVCDGFAHERDNAFFGKTLHPVLKYRGNSGHHRPPTCTSSCPSVWGFQEWMCEVVNTGFYGMNTFY